MNVALPSLITNLHASLDEALWVVNSGPVLGGVLTTYLTWRWVFYVNLPIAVAGIVLAYSYVPVHATSLTFAPVLLVAGLGMGAIFAPLPTMALQAAPRHLVGAASGVLNTGRQLGATLGGAVTGAVLASQLAPAIQARAVTAARVLPAADRPAFVSGFGRATQGGLQVGRGQLAGAAPPGTPPRLVALLRQLVSDVFGHAYVAAMRPTLEVSVGLLLAGAALCLLLRRSPAALAANGTTAHDTTGRDGIAVPSVPARQEPQEQLTGRDFTR